MWDCRQIAKQERLEEHTTMLRRWSKSSSAVVEADADCANVILQETAHVVKRSSLMRRNSSTTLIHKESSRALADATPTPVGARSASDGKVVKRRLPQVCSESQLPVLDHDVSRPGSRHSANGPSLDQQDDMDGNFGPSPRYHLRRTLTPLQVMRKNSRSIETTEWFKTPRRSSKLRSIESTEKSLAMLLERDASDSSLVIRPRTRPDSRELKLEPLPNQREVKEAEALAEYADLGKACDTRKLFRDPTKLMSAWKEQPERQELTQYIDSSRRLSNQSMHAKLES